MDQTSAVGDADSAAPDAELVIGVDVGGTKICSATMRDGVLGSPTVCPTAHHDAGALLEQLVAMVLEAGAGTPPKAVGLGVPSVVEFATGRVRSSINVPLRDVPLRQVLRERLGVPVFVDNDATVAALAEAHDERGSLDVSHLVMLTVGTGVGGGIVIDGRIFRGATGAAGELGHTLVSIDERIPPGASFPQAGSLEALAAGHVLDRLARAAVTDHPTSALARIHAERGAVAGPDVVAAAADGDPIALDIIALLGRRIGIAVANAINTFDPHVVAIGGGVSGAGEMLLEPARTTARQYIVPGVGDDTEIRLARWGAEAGVRGAALLARTELTRASDAAVHAGTSRPTATPPYLSSRED